MPDGKCYVGTSGWSYAHSAKGAYVYCNNDIDAHAIKNAHELIDTVVLGAVATAWHPGVPEKRPDGRESP